MDTNTEAKPKSGQGAAAVNYRRDELRPLPMRITQKQYERLIRQRDFDSVNIQEHVRRALDFYLNAQDLVIIRARVRAGELPTDLLLPQRAPDEAAQVTVTDADSIAIGKSTPNVVREHAGLPKIRSR